MKITDFAVDRPVAISMLVMIVMVVGLISVARLGIDLMPDISYPTLSVMVRYPGAPSEEVESIVAKPYEGSLASISGVERIRTISQEDVCYLMVDFTWGTDLDSAAADIRDAVAMLEPFMPPDVQSPVVIKFNLSALPQAAYIVSGMDDVVALRELIKTSAQPKLERIEGVAQAQLMGGRVEEIRVDVSRDALRATGLTLDRVAMALMSQNLNVPAGRQVEGHSEVLLRTMGAFESLDDIRMSTVSISPTTGEPVRLSSIAETTRGTQDVRSFVRSSGQESVMMMLLRESGANPLDLRRAYLAQLEKLDASLPSEITFSMLFDMGATIEQMAGAVVSNGLVGAVLAVIVMFIFLRNLRPTLIIAVVIPLSLLATFIPIYVTGDTLNMMTMGGLVLGVGMLVDNAVVVIESIFRHIEDGKERHLAAKLGSSEVGMAIIASTATTMVVFLPILFSQGLAGQMARGLAITVAAALFSSLFVALTIVPMLASVFFSSKSGSGVLDEGRAFSRIRQRYERVLAWCVGHRKATLGVTALVVVGTMGLIPLTGAEFMPPTSNPLVTAKVTLPIGSSLEETSAVSAKVEQILNGFSDVVTVGTSLGVDSRDAGAGLNDGSPSGVHEAILFANLKERDLREYRSIDDFKRVLRERLPTIEGARIEFVDLMSSTGNTKPIEVKLVGADFAVLKLWSDRIAERLRSTPGLVDVDTSLQAAKPERHIVVDREKAAAYGLTVGQVATEVKNATLGLVATRFRDQGDEIDVRVRYAEPWRDTDEQLRQVLITLPTGGAVPLGQLARLDDGTGPVRIIREDQARTVTIDASVVGVPLSDAFTQVETALAPLRSQLPAGYDLRFGGQVEDMKDAFVQLTFALMLAILLVYMVMAAQFESYSHPFAILFTMPLAAVGVVWIFLLTGTNLSVASFLGLIMLAGIVVNNGIVLIDYINQLRLQGMDIFEATVKGSATRLRPVAITSLTTVMAMVPMAVSNSEGAEIMSPLALTMIGGLVASSIFTLVVVPVVYTIIDAAAARVSATFVRLLHTGEVQPEG